MTAEYQANSDAVLDYIVTLLQATYGCHTVILYGSRARGDFQAHSDYDVAGIRADGDKVRHAEHWQGAYVDAFVYDEAHLERLTPGLLTLQDGQVLVQKDHYGEELLTRINAYYEAGPPPLDADERQARQIWAWKMIARAETADIEGNFRRVWLLTALLEDYFVLRTQWYLGPKKSFVWLKLHDPQTYEAYQNALEPNASLVSLQTLVERVVGNLSEGNY